LSHHGTTIATSPTASAIGVPTLVRATYDATTGVGSIAIDGVVVGSGPGPANTDGTLQFGAYGLSAGFKGAIAEAVVYNLVLAPFDLALVEAYFAASYQSVTAPDVGIRRCPRDGELLPRHTSTNLATLDVSGAVFTGGYTTVRLEVRQNNAAFANVTAPLVYSGGSAGFSFTLPLPAGLHDYDLMVIIDAGGPATYVHVAENVVVGDVILVNGQSNAVAQDGYTENLANGSQSDWIRSFGTQAFAPAVGGGFPPDVTCDYHWDKAEGEDAFGHASVGAWALRLGELLVQSQGVPIAILNGALGGTTIAQHQRNAALPTDPSTIYGRLLLRARTASVATSARAMIWHQGEADFLQPASYTPLLQQLYADWFTDYPALERVFIVQSRISCGVTTGEVPEVHRSAPATLPVTSVMSSSALPGYDGCHYYYAGYRELGNRLAAQLGRDLYGAAPLPNVDSPNMASVAWTSTTHNAIVITYQSATDPLTLQTNAHQHFVLDDLTVTIQSASVSGNTVTLQLSGPSTATVLDYNGANGVTTLGSPPQPWIVNGAGIGALTFFHAAIL
jgi:hypothetical protein